jgi:hypothetical protein
MEQLVEAKVMRKRPAAAAAATPAERKQGGGPTYFADGVAEEILPAD